MWLKTVPKFSPLSIKRCYSQDVLLHKNTFNDKNKETDGSAKPKGWDDAKSYESIPGPKPLPIIGNSWIYFAELFYKIDYIKQMNVLHDTYGKIVALRNMGKMKDMVIITDPTDIETMFRNEGQWPFRDGNYSLEHYRNVIRKDVFGDAGSLLTTQEESWQKLRTIVNPILMQPRIAAQYIKPMNNIADDFIKRMQYLAKQNPLSEMPDDFDNELNKWAFESIGIVALDRRLGCLDKNPNLESQKMVKYMVEIFKMMLTLDYRPIGAIYKKYNFGVFKKFVEYQDYFTNLALKYIDEAADKIKHDMNYKNKPEHEKSAFEKMLKKDKMVAVVTTLDMLSAGIDTTGKTTGSILYFLAKHPEKQDKLRKEIMTLLPTPDTPITKELLEQMTYLKAVIKEAQRISPIATGNLRRTTKDIVLAGYQIPSGVNVILPHLLLCLQECHYKRANEFIPERWLKSSQGELSYKNTHPFVTMPFGYGPRYCIGQRLAILEMQIVVAKIVRNFFMEWPHPDAKFGVVLLYGIEDPLKIRVKQIIE